MGHGLMISLDLSDFFFQSFAMLFDFEIQKYQEEYICQSRYILKKKNAIKNFKKLIDKQSIVQF